MKKWVLYYLLSLLAVVLIEFLFAAIIIYIIGDLFSIASEPMFSALRLLILLTILLLQSCALYQNKKNREVRLKFLIAFCCIYSILFTVAYLARTYIAFYYCAENRFIGSHTWFLLPLILQIAVFIVLGKKKSFQKSQAVS